MSRPSPLLVCHRPRLAEGVASAAELEATGPHLGLLGDWSWLFAVVAGQARLLGGRLEVVGIDAGSLLASGCAGALPPDSSLPPSFRVGRLLGESARLLGHDRVAASLRARQALEVLGIESLKARKMAELDAAERRGVGLALAVLGDPQALLLDQPFDGLEPSSARRVLGWVSRAIEGREAIISLPSLGESPEHDALLQGVDEVLVLGSPGLGLAARGSLEELSRDTERYRVVVSRHATELCAMLESLGYESRLSSDGSFGVLSVKDARHQGTSRLLGAAARADAPVLELLPLAWSRQPS